MTTSAFIPRLLAGTFSAALLGSCGMARTVQSADVAASAAPPSAGSLEAVTTLIGDAECDDAGQCRAVGIGAKPCGGPAGYRAWSSKKTDPQALRAAVEAHAQARKQEDSRRGLVSDCRVAPEPTAVCRPRPYDGKKTCQLGQGGVRSAI